MACVPSEYLLEQLFVNAKAGAPSPGLPGILTGSLIGLYTPNIVPVATTLLAALTPPTYTGYAAKAATWSAPYRRQSGGIAIASAQLVFQETSTITPVVIYGYCLMDSTSTYLLLSEYFGSNGLNLTDALSAIVFSSEFCLGGVDYGVMSLSS